MGGHKLFAIEYISSIMPARCNVKQVLCTSLLALGSLVLFSTLYNDAIFYTALPFDPPRQKRSHYTQALETTGA